MGATRRTFMKAVVVAASTPAAAWAPPVVAASLQNVIERHRLAINVDRAAWARVADINEELSRIGHKASRRTQKKASKAVEQARATGEAVKALEAEIVQFVPATLGEAGEKARWIVWACDDDYCYIDDTEEGIRSVIEALRAIGRAVA
jgi:hypothetical protein